MSEKERIKIRNLTLVQNIVVSIAYVFGALMFFAAWAAVSGLFDEIGTQRKGGVSDVSGWAILIEGFFGIVGVLIVAIFGALMVLFTVYTAFMWFMFWKANRGTRPFRKRKPWGIADQICKILIGLFAVGGVFDTMRAIFTEGTESADGGSLALEIILAVFFTGTGIYLLIEYIKKREEIENDGI